MSDASRRAGGRCRFAHHRLHLVAKCVAFSVVVFTGLAAVTRAGAAEHEPARPNVVFILADDLGYGDLGCYGSTIKTPHLDRLAREGRLFTDAHSSAAVCTPTRYAIMTGREWFRRRTKWNYELTVPVDRVSLPAMMKSAGYATGLIGKWHLGYGEKAPNWNGELKPGPLECGFDRFFGTAMTHNEPPQVLVKNHRVVNLSPDDPITIVPPPPGVMFGKMQGGKQARVVHDELGVLHTEKAVEFIEQHKDRPFFLYYGMINVHGPIAPGKRFQGASRFGPYGDYVLELDWSVGEILATLDRLKLADNTLVIFASDNGGVLYKDVVEAGHMANASFLGQKTDVWEGGHRVPFIVRWPGRVPPGTRSGELICLADMLATLAAVVGRDLGPEDGPDSFNALPAILDQPGHAPVRRLLTSIGIFGMAIREGKWKLIPGHGSAGFSTVPNHAWTPPWKAGRQTSDYTSDGQLKPDAPPGQLYNLEQDPGETVNVYAQHPEVVERLTRLLAQLRKEDRSQRELAADLDRESRREYPREHIYDTSVFADEALVNVSVAANRWPDCTTLESAVRDIFRIEGVLDGSDQDKALALWKWFRILVSGTGGHYAYEGPPGSEILCSDPHKIFTVYGHHQCDGQSWAMVALWRAAGYMALDECTLGHTTAALRYRDIDGQFRYHSFDPQHRNYHWDELNQRVGTRSMPVMRGMVYRHLTAPQHVHSLRTSLGLGESVERRWDNSGRIVPSGKDKLAALEQPYYAYRPGTTRGVYAAVGEEFQVLEADTRPATYARRLHEGSDNVACSAAEPGRATLHPAKSGVPGVLVYRLAPPYMVADAHLEATLLKTNPEDRCEVSISRDGEQWTPAFSKKSVGEERMTVNVGFDAWKQGLPNVYTAYDFYVKVEMQTGGEPRDVGLQDLKIVVHRMLNKRTLPNLRPGVNVLRVTADRMDEDCSLKLALEYQVDGEAHTKTHLIDRFPYYFRIDIPDVPEDIQENYDQRFNEGRLRMVALSMTLAPRDQGKIAPSTLSEAEALRLWAMSSPHPANMDHREPMARAERDVRETSGFFPQADEAIENDEAMQALMKEFHGGDIEQAWRAAEDLGAYPKALDALLAEVPKANGDRLLFLCKALAQIKDPRAAGPLLDRWKQAPRGAPGSRYIPDVLAAIGDASVVPQLIAPLERCRFDYRFHIARALGILGGPEAEAALEDLAAHDPFPAVREEARLALERLRR